jgi:hypothetical protein
VTVTKVGDSAKYKGYMYMTLFFQIEMAVQQSGTNSCGECMCFILKNHIKIKFISADAFPAKWNSSSEIE